MKKLFRMIVLGLIVILMFNVTVNPAVANQLKKENLGTMDNLSKTEKQIITNHLDELKISKSINSEVLSKENKQIANKSLESIEDNLIYADIVYGNIKVHRNAT